MPQCQAGGGGYLQQIVAICCFMYLNIEGLVDNPGSTFPGFKSQGAGQHARQVHDVIRYDVLLFVGHTIRKQRL